MRGTEFTNALHAEPFKPFTLHFPSGKTIRIANPGLVVVSDTGRMAVAFKPGVDGLDIIDMTLVERIEFGNGEDRGRRNGPAKR